MAVGQFTLAEAAKLLNEASIIRKIANLYAATAEMSEDLAQSLSSRADMLEAQALHLLVGDRT